MSFRVRRPQPSGAEPPALRRAAVAAGSGCYGSLDLSSRGARGGKRAPDPGGLKIDVISDELEHRQLGVCGDGKGRLDPLLAVRAQADVRGAEASPFRVDRDDIDAADG